MIIIEIIKINISIKLEYLIVEVAGFIFRFRRGN